MTSREVLRHWRVLPTSIESQIRRITWARQLLIDPEHNRQLLTAIFGKLDIEDEDTINDDGSLREHANAYAKRFITDLQEARSRLPTFDEQLGGLEITPGTLLTAEMDECLPTLDPKELRQTYLTTTIPSPGSQLEAMEDQAEEEAALKPECSWQCKLRHGDEECGALFATKKP